jgi:hypothetical protein
MNFKKEMFQLKIENMRRITIILVFSENNGAANTKTGEVLLTVSSVKTATRTHNMNTDRLLC